MNGKYGLNELRGNYLKFFEDKGHLVLPSFPLIPKNDPSLLLIGAGMAPLKPFFTGAEKPPRIRVATCQKCIRTPDIDNVGLTSRHGTFFEMLGNFSFGDYFKKEAINWAWEYLTEELEIDRDLLYVSVYEKDDEAYDLWMKVDGINESKISRLGKEDNFWELVTGPCGPCSEIYYDRGERYGQGKPGDGTDRFIEVWNLVFTQFDKDEEGNYKPLPKPNIDTGMGLERLAMVCQGAKNLFEVDTIRGILDKVCEFTGREYGSNEKDDISIRVITDHIRGVVHMISEGILPSNEGRGYVLRRLLRRAVRHGRMLGSAEVFLHSLAEKAIELSETAYPALSERKPHIFEVIRAESERFEQTLDSGLEVLRGMLEKTKGNELKGPDVFKLHDTFGFPIELTKEIAGEHGKDVDEKGFRELMTRQKDQAREAFGKRNPAWFKGSSSAVSLKGIKSIFVGYEKTEAEGKAVKLFKENGSVACAYAGENVSAIFDRTPFYAESGGQVADTGIVTGNGLSAKVADVRKIDGLHVHMLEITEGKIEPGRGYMLKVDRNTREGIMRNHTATHILHRTLCDELGAHAEQKGSYVDAARLRFDFCHYHSIDKEVLDKIENKVNSVIFSALPVSAVTMKIGEAKKLGAKAIFEEKYSENVRVVSIEGYSKELCGGTHVSNTGQIGPFRILSETSAASGIRRIEAVTGFNTLEYYGKRNKALGEIAALMKSDTEGTKEKIIAVLEKNRELYQELEALKKKIMTEEMEENRIPVTEINGISIVSRVFRDVDMNTMRETADSIREKYKDSVVLFGAVNGPKADFLVYSSEKAISRGVKAGEIIKDMAGVAGGGGGGRPNMAQAGGKNPEMTEKAVEKGLETVKRLLS